jgi:hypothetical protein
MNKNIKLAVAGAVLALSATANAGIIIPAGDWTLDIGGNVNTFATSTRVTGATVTGGGIYGSDYHTGSLVRRMLTSENQVCFLTDQFGMLKAIETNNNKLCKTTIKLLAPSS